MLRFFKFSVIALLLVSQVAFANTVAVLDSRQAILNSRSAKQSLAKLDKAVSADRAKLIQVQKDMSTLELEFQRKRNSLNAQERAALQQQAQKKLAEYNQLGASIQRRIEDSQSELLTVLMPKLKAGVNYVKTKNNIDIVIEKKYVYAVSDAWDITHQVTQHIDSH